MERLENMIKTVTKFKTDFVSEKEECKKLKEANLKLEIELKETRELEKSHRYHLQTSREMIGKLQNTVSHLVHLKRDYKKINDELVSKDMLIASMEKDKENAQQTMKETIEQLREAHDKYIEELKNNNEKKLQQMQCESDNKIAHLTCVVEELKEKLNNLEAAYTDKMNVVVLEYEEKVQRSAVETSQLHEQLRQQAARSEANIEGYRRKIEDLEQKLKQSRFKEYLAQTNSSNSSQSQFENRVERPYSAQNNYMETTVSSIPVQSYPKPNQAFNRNIKTPTLQVMYQGSKVQNLPKDEKKGQFSIKKRKLYSDKDFLNL